VILFLLGKKESVEGRIWQSHDQEDREENIDRPCNEVKILPFVKRGCVWHGADNERPEAIDDAGPGSEDN
jgi:hypothetical protein